MIRNVTVLGYGQRGAFDLICMRGIYGAGTKKALRTRKEQVVAKVQDQLISQSLLKIVGEKVEK